MKLNLTTIMISGAIVLPGIITYGARMLGQAPSVAAANEVDRDQKELVHIPDINFIVQTPGEIDSRFINSPFWHEPLEIEDVFAPFEHEELEPPKEDQEIYYDVTLTTILPHPKNPLAVINGKPYKIGDFIDQDWQLIMINGDKRAIKIRHRSGKIQNITLKTQGG